MNQPARIAQQSYGKSLVRLTKVTRHADRHELKEIAVDIVLEGAFEASYLAGDNRCLVATDTMKNTVYALAAGHPLDSIESFAVALADHFIDRNDHVTAATVTIEEASWRRIENEDGLAHPHAFIAGGTARRTCRVRNDRTAPQVEAGVTGLTLVKTTNSAFRDFLRDEFTTLIDADDRIFGTSVEGRWRYAAGSQPGWNAAFTKVCRTLVDVFAAHRSLAVQQTLYDMGRAALAACPEVEEIALEMPNQHRIPLDLTPFGLPNRHEIFVTTSEPYGLIRATLHREI
ncbi:MAG: factor-independent urate hydroxylase [Pirellulales bacterium]